MSIFCVQNFCKKSAVQICAERKGIRMSKDISQKRLEEYNDVFIDIFNNIIFGGKQVLRSQKEFMENKN